MLVLRNEGPKVQVDVVHVIHVHEDFVVGPYLFDFFWYSQRLQDWYVMMFHSVLFFLLQLKVAVGMEYFVCEWPHWHKHLHPSACYVFVVFMGGIETHTIHYTLQECFLISNKQQLFNCIVHLAANHSHMQAPGTPVLVLRWERQAETMRWYQHLEAATRQSRSARDILREVPLLSVLVLRLIQDNGINMFDERNQGSWYCMYSFALRWLSWWLHKFDFVPPLIFFKVAGGRSSPVCEREPRRKDGTNQRWIIGAGSEAKLDFGDVGVEIQLTTRQWFFKQEYSIT